MNHKELILKYVNLSLSAISFLNPIFLLSLRLWLAKVFFMSGLTKIQSWETTLMLFQYEYSVPFIPYQIAAWSATIAELLIPIFLALGLLTRLNTIPLFILNIVAAISYPDISPAGEKDHIIWGLIMLMLFFSGPGKIAIDKWVLKNHLSTKL